MKTLSTFAFVAVLALSGPTSAALVQFSAVIDLTGCPNNGPGFCLSYTVIPPVTLAVGDTVDYTITFAGSQRLAMFDDTNSSEQFFAWMFDAQAGGFFTISDASIDFLALTGTLLTPLAATSQVGGTVHIGFAFFGDIIAMGSSISFGGYHTRYTVDALPANPNTYGSNAMFAIADRVEVIAVPEPSGTTLVGLGLVAMLWAVYERRRRERRNG